MIALAALTTVLFIREDFDRVSDGRRRINRTRPEGATSNWPIIGALLMTAMMVLLANMSIEPIITVYIGHLGVAFDDQARMAGVVMACSALGRIPDRSQAGCAGRPHRQLERHRWLSGVDGHVTVPQAFVTQWWQLAVLRGVMGMTLAGLLPAIARLIRHWVEEHNTGKVLGYLQSAQFSGR